MGAEKEQDIEKLVDEQAKEEATEAEEATDAEVDQRKNKSGRGALVISS